MGTLLFGVIGVLTTFVLCFIHMHHCQSLCSRQSSSEWHPKQHKVQMNWTLVGNICRSFPQCLESHWADILPRAKYPQLCPLQLQYGDTLLMAADETLKQYGFRILHVSESKFESCTPTLTKDQFLLPHNLNENLEVEAKWLVPGNHYFIAVHDQDTHLCTLGLRINITVKTQLCQASPLLRICSGNGICQTGLWEKTYRCICRHQYFGRFCEKFDVCLDNPCENKGICLSDGTTELHHRTYKCLCPPHFNGVTCSEIIGRENCERLCEHGLCVQVSASSFSCICDTQSSDPPCHQRKCDPSLCINGGTCVEGPRGFICHCPETFSGVRCEFHTTSNCSSSACHQEPLCTPGERISQCTSRQQSLCSPSPCHNNATCVSKGSDYICRCLRGFSGKNCEEIIDYCRPLNISCLNEGLCLSVIGSYQCLCAPGWTGECCQYAADACLINAKRCVNGATCISTNQPSEPLEFVCKCPNGFTGTNCEKEINECDSIPCQHNGTCSDLVGRYKCKCPTGFDGVNCEVDIDACSLPNSTCPPQAECLDLPNGLQYMCRTPCPPSLQPCANGGRCVLNDASSYTCICTPGWSGQNCRINVNDCAQHWCQNGGTCVDEIDGYSCLCPKGYTGLFCEEDIDFCVGHSCSEHSVCVDGWSNFTCRCMYGYEGPLCEQETDECRSSPCAAGATCVDLISDYQCHCPPGFEGRICSENVDDCWSQPCLNGGICVDLTNDYTCHCPLGFKGKDCSVDIDLCSFGICSAHTLICTESRDGHNVSCVCERGFFGSFCEVNLNECESKPCQNGGACVDGIDQYQCACLKGYGGLNCEINFDECAYGYCANNSTCIDLAGDYKCICPPGITGKNCSTDVSGCALEVEYCKNGGTCSSNVLGETRCVCPLGYYGFDCSSAANHCSSNPCDPEGALSCEDLVNTYTCVCRHGYAGPQCTTHIAHCIDHLCQHGATCMNLSPGFMCYCLPGFTGQYCEINIDDCEGNPCGSLSICKDAVNGFHCFCAPGFVGPNCEVEVNECLSNPCLNSGSCADELNSFSCLCLSGITGRFCEINIDECASSPCLNNAKCVDLVLGFECVCNPGYTGENCEVDIDECESLSCKNGATCIDQPGNYFCQCVAPFKGHNCEFLPCEASNPCENDAVCVEELDQDHFPLGFRCRCRQGFDGPRCEINVDECSSSPCLHGFCYDVVDGFYCLCNPGYAGPRCDQDIDDCVNHSCSRNSVCRDHHLTYECVCHSGWEGEFCQKESDECLSHPCKNNATCTDLLGAFKCTCGIGWTGVDCAVNVDECESDPCLNGARCQESHVPGEFHCTCPPFYRGAVCSQPFHPCDPPHNPCQHHSTCLTRSDGTALCICSAGFEGSWCEINTNECTSDPCHSRGFCLDGVNGYRCECEMGFFGLQCEQDVDECASNPCQHDATCQNLENMFFCTCLPGYFGARCDLDVDECEVSPCLHQGICINKPGAFECVCRPGYSGARCEVNIDECVSNPCQNTGRCIDGQSQFHCLCSDGFIGLNCEINIDECMSAPCLHGRCVDGIGMFSCLCEQGWTGLWCEENIDDCAFSPCQNGGSCVDLIDKFACFCRDGFSGKTCENDIDLCAESAHNTTLCFNGGTCVDGKGSNFTCSCPPGFTGDFCEVDFNECCSAPCHNGGICQDLINSYVCHCRSGWTGLHCEDDINECLPHPCDQGICIQNDPGYGYTCFCRPGFVGKNCEHNYDDCLLNPCPAAFSCVDGVNGVSCVAPASDTVPMETTVNTSSPPHPAAALTPRSTANVKYFGDSFLEFDGIEMNLLNDITLRFQTRSSQGTILYMDQGPTNNQFFFLKVFITEGVLKYAFNCHEEDEVTHINTTVQINDDTAHMLNIRQHLNPCVSEVTLSGYSTIKSAVSNYWSGNMLQRTQHIFVGGLPLRYRLNQKSELFDNFTGCIEIIEINKRRSFLASDAIANSNTGECRNTTHPTDIILPRLDPSTNSYLNDSTVTQTEKSSSDEAPVCFRGLCQNGGTCYTQHHFNKSIPLCHCPLHFTGPFCEKDATVYIPRFDVDSYLELQPLVSLLRSSGDSYNLPTTNKDTTVILQLTLKTRSTQGTILYTQTLNFGEQFVHVFLEDGSPVVQLSCGRNHVLRVAAEKSINTDRWVNLIIRYNLPVGKQDRSCMIEIAVDNGPAQHLEEYVSSPMLKETFGPIFLGALSAHREMLGVSVKRARRFMGCIREFWVNSKEIYLVGEGTMGRNIMNCEPLVCQLLPCRNGGTCVSSAEDWFCECAPQYTGRLCQLSACEHSPCAHGATCIPTSALEAVCLCPYGREGLLCDQVVNITRPRFSGNDEFGYTSFMAYSFLPSLAFFYEFKLEFILANNSSAVKDNLILYAGYKGQGNHGDDFLALGIKSGRVVHRFNLGSGVATIVSDRLDQSLPVHTVMFGRAKRTGWLKVDGQRNRTGSSRGPLVGLNVFNQLFVGGYNEYTPELLPLGSRFRHGFQGCIFDVLFRSGVDRKLGRLGSPLGQSSFGRSVGQCGVTPCSHVLCRNGGTCMDSGSSVYCQCQFGWKGALCTETVSVCDVEHRPPPLCAPRSTCVPLLHGYTCHCPLGTAGLYCDKAVTITDPFFSGNQSSWMSFAPLRLRYSTVLELQFQPLAPDGILIYTAQHLNTRAGDFFCLSLTSGHVQLSYDLGDGTHVLRSAGRVDPSGRAWHRVKAGRIGPRGFLSLDDEEITQNHTTRRMTTLDVETDLFVGGVSSLSSVAFDATEGVPVGFTGGLRELIVNGLDLDLSERGAVSGENVGDWDGTACGYKVCQNQGRCSPIGTASFMCVCPPAWTGPLCDQSVGCAKHDCKHDSLCSADNSTSYRCLCALGWTGRFCDTEMSTDTFRFRGNSYIKYTDKRYNTRDLKYTQILLSVLANRNDSLIMWMGKAEHENEDYLAIGLEEGKLKIAVNLGERLPEPLRFETTNLCCNTWHNISITLNRTVIQVFLNNNSIIHENIEPFERYVALNYGGTIYLGGFELGRNTTAVTSGIFDKGYDGSIKNVYLYNDIKPVQFFSISEGFNVNDGNNSQ